MTVSDEIGIRSAIADKGTKVGNANVIQWSVELQARGSTYRYRWLGARNVHVYIY